MVSAASAASAVFSAICLSRPDSLASCSAAWARTWARAAWMSAADAPSGLPTRSATPPAMNRRSPCRRAISTRVLIRSPAALSRSATAATALSSTRVWPACTCWPSATLMAWTVPVSIGWITLLLPTGRIEPGAAAMMSTLPMLAQTMATVTKPTMENATRRAAGEAGVSTISSAAGRKSSLDTDGRRPGPRRAAAAAEAKPWDGRRRLCQTASCRTSPA